MKAPFFSKKALSSFLITLLLLPLVFFAIPPKKTDAFWPVFDWTNVIQNTISAITGGVTAGATTVSAGTSISQFMKSYVLDTVATAFARALLRKITAQTVNWINTGFQGNPAFVSDPGQFFLDTGDNVASQYFLGSNSPLNALCAPFQPQVRLALVKSYLQVDQFNSQCTFNKIGSNFETFTKNFKNGGWDSWFAMTQNNQNNPYGAYLDASKQLSLKIGTQNTKYEKQLLQGKGFLSYEVCPEGKTVGEIEKNKGPITGKPGDACEPDSGASCGPGLKCGAKFTCEVVDSSYLDDNGNYSSPSRMTGQSTSDCTVAKQTVTPGSVIAEKLTKSLNSTETTLELTNSINQVINALFNQMVTQVFNSVQGGLRGLSKSQPSTGARTSLLEMIQASSTTSSFQGEKKAIEATVPAQFQPALTGGDPTPIYTPPSEADVINKANADKAKYACQINGGGTPGADTTPPTGVPGTVGSVDPCATTGTADTSSTP